MCQQSGTVFAPSKEAFERLEREMGESEFKRMMEESGATILGMHFLDQRIPAQDIRISNPQNEIKVSLTENRRRDMLLNIMRQSKTVSKSIFLFTLPNPQQIRSEGRLVNDQNVDVEIILVTFNCHSTNRT